MRKEYIFYSALGALVAYELFINRDISTSSQYIEMIEVTAEAETLDEVVTAEGEIVTLLENALPIIIAVGLVPVIFNIFKAFLEP